jgi:2-oxoglutarate dehydrogenase complex dehydrogenase (E1) component-like enzyme
MLTAAAAVRLRALSGLSAPSAAAVQALADLRRHGWQRAHTNPLRAPGPAPASPLEAAYCGRLGAEFEHCAAPEERQWVASQLEAHLPAFALSPSDSKNYWRLLASAEAFEAFLSKKLATLKRYGGEGAEAQLPALHTLLASALAGGASHAVVSSAHRGRLATQVCLLRYPARKLFWKLRGLDDIPGAHPGVDDVSSHVAVSCELHVGRPWGTPGAPGAPPAAASHGALHVSLLPNPSHLEAVNPVAMGKARALQDALGGSAAARAVPVCIHGDAAVAGQGVVYETSLLASARGYAVGGTLHLICNNQVGFTHAPAGSAAGAFARGAGFPIFHVNAESPRDVVFACRLAAAFRARFAKDAVVNLIGYRRNGHNEVDEPAFTNPAMYAGIRARESHTEALGRELEGAGVLGAGERQRFAATAAAHLEAEYSASEPGRGGFSQAAGSMGGDVAGESGGGFSRGGAWSGFRVAASDGEAGACPPTGVALQVLRAVGAASVALPPAPFVLHPRLLRGHVTPRLEALEVGKEGSVSSG